MIQIKRQLQIEKDIRVKYFFNITITVVFTFLLTVSAKTLHAETLVVYSGRSDALIQPVLNAFTKQSGIQIVLLTGKSRKLLNKLEREGDRSGADVFISNDASTLQKGSDMNLLAPLPIKMIAPLGKNFRSPDNTWAGLSARGQVLVINNNSEAKKFVKSVFDLADPRLKGRLGITSSTNESYIASVTIYMLSTDTDKTAEWLNGLKQNINGQVFDKYSSIVDAVALGKLDVGLVNHYFITRYLASHPDAPISLVIPDQGEHGIGVAWDIAGIGISRFSKHRVAAEKLVDFLLSDEGQKQFAQANREYPIRNGVSVDTQAPAVGSFKIANVPMVELGRQRNKTIELIETIGMP